MPDIAKVLHRHIGILRKSKRMQEVFKEEPMAAYKRDRNLADILVHGKLKRDMPRQRPRCKADSIVCAIQIKI